MKRLLSMLLALTLGLSLIVPAARTEAADGKKYSLRLATHYNTEHLGYAALERIKEKLETESEGRLEITLYPSSQLGDYTLTFEELMEGTIDLGLIPVPSEYDSRLEMNFIPYLINGYDGMGDAFGEGSYFFENYTKILRADTPEGCKWPDGPCSCHRSL